MILERQNRVVLMAIMGLFVLMASACAANLVSPAMPYLVRADRVADTLAARGISVQPGQLEFLASVKSSRRYPELEIEHLQATGRGSVLARIRCREAGVCLPFLVVLHLTARQHPEAILERLPATKVQFLPAGNQHRPNWMVKTGQTATLVMQGKDVRATTPVICLQNGRRGESIRVSSLDRKRTMVGEIVGPGLLQGAL